MGLSRSGRIILLLAIDTVFFFLEIIVGIMVKSLALVADSFHMLNDVFSLLVALWAIKLAKSKSTNDYTYGWQRAEVLGALVNGVFLLALCFSIFLEAIQRFFDPQVITNPWLILGVGSAGLASNIVGLFLFHDHGHSHGESGHSHSHSHDAEAQPTMPVNCGTQEEEEHSILSESGNIEDVLPGSYVARATASSQRQRHFSDPARDIHVYPALNRQEVVRAAASEGSESAVSESETEDEHTPLVGRNRADSKSWHRDHNHSKPRRTEKSQSLNMRGVFLHVLGDALGNVGVILTALFVRFAPSHPTLAPFTNYADPAISLIITIIIFSSALPLVKSASKILLQGVPKGISLDEVTQDIASIPGVESVHELHIWQLSDVKLIASLHIQIAFDPQTDGQSRHQYMRLAKAIKHCLHGFGVHSVTIQPEYLRKDSSNGASGSYGAVQSTDETNCLLECGEECGQGKCCAPVDPDTVGMNSHGHAH